MTRLLFLLASFAWSASALAADLKSEGEQWKQHVAALAANNMEGRFTGTGGYRRAADYVAKAFGKAGLKPAGTDGWLQPVEYEEQVVDMDASRVAIDGLAIAVGQEILLGTRYPQPEKIEAPLFFVGYGLHLPEAGYDDFAEGDLKGKILVTISGGPDSISGALKSHARSEELNKVLQKIGAVGLISIPNPRYSEIPWSRQRLLARQKGLYLSDPALRAYPGTLFSATANPDWAEKLFAGSGHDWSTILADAKADRPLPRFALKGKVTAQINRHFSKVTAPNIVGRLEGSDPKLKDEIVVLSAHLDHLGVGEPIGGDPIYHGAMDNASGIATLIETAKAAAALKPRPKRSLLFLAVAGEERGLLGSHAFAEHPSGLNGGRLVADINMDMFLPLFPLKSLIVFGADESSLGAIAADVTKAQGIQIVPDPAPNQNRFVRSDQYSFIRKGIPALNSSFASTGDEEAAIQKNWRTERYHAPADNMSQPIDLEAAAAYDRYTLALLVAIANSDTRPAWLPNSFFKRFAGR